TVVPSTFPEAFGMVAAEAAACGALPISAAHSGLAEVSQTLAASLPSARELVSFPLSDDAVLEIARRIIRWLRTPAPARPAAGAGAGDCGAQARGATGTLPDADRTRLAGEQPRRAGLLAQAAAAAPARAQARRRGQAARRDRGHHAARAARPRHVRARLRLRA